LSGTSSPFVQKDSAVGHVPIACLSRSVLAFRFFE
jgi:hypothetical protein